MMKGTYRETAVKLYACAAVLLVTPGLTACGGSNTNKNLSSTGNYSENPAATTAPNQRRPSLSMGKKVALLAGAAALYYLYKQNQKKREAGASVPQYYISSNGRVYYRDSQHRVHWVTAPSSGIEVPVEEAREYRDMQGYQGRSTGRGLAGLSNSRSY